MNELIAQAKARLEAAGITTHDSVVLGAATYPYALLWGGEVGRHSVDLGRPRGHLADRLGVTIAGLMPESVRNTARRVHALLDGWVPDPGDGWHFDEVRVREGESDAITADADAPLVGTLRVLYMPRIYDVSATPLT